MPYATTTPAPKTGGLPYASATVLTATEVSLFNQSTQSFQDPIATIAGQAIQAVVQFTATGTPATNSTYVVMQTDMGDGVWIDVAWCLWIGTTGTVIFTLGGGVAGANSIQQTRAAGSAPASNGSNQMAFGGRVRFVGKAALTGGTAPAVTATIKYRMLTLR